MIRKLQAICLIGMFITGSLWLVAEFAPMPTPKNVVMDASELGEVSDLMQEALDELKRRQEAN